MHVKEFDQELIDHDTSPLEAGLAGAAHDGMAPEAWPDLAPEPELDPVWDEWIDYDLRLSTRGAR